ncbi:MAG: hypothetical protein IPH07_39115 [Deltaproteobacteria bacterium]|nr:hypothetical protein [Deltaproteobacteria bacterium]
MDRTWGCGAAGAQPRGQGDAQLVEVGVSLGRELAGAAGEDREQARIHLDVTRVGQGGGADGLEQRGQGVARERRSTGDEAVDRHARRPLIGCWSDHALDDVLGRHEVGRARERAGLRDPGLEHVRQAEIEQHRPLDAGVVDAEQHVLGLDVAMHDAVAVHRFEARQHAEHEPHGAVLIERSVRGDAAGEIIPLEQLHHEVRRATIVDDDVVHLHDGGVTDARDGPRLADEAIVRLGVIAAHPFDGDHAVEPEVTRAPHLAHAADPEAIEQSVAPLEQAIGVDPRDLRGRGPSFGARTEPPKRVASFSAHGRSAGAVHVGARSGDHTTARSS